MKKLFIVDVDYTFLDVASVISARFGVDKSQIVEPLKVESVSDGDLLDFWRGEMYDNVVPNQEILNEIAGNEVIFISTVSSTTAIEKKSKIIEDFRKKFGNNSEPYFSNSLVCILTGENQEAIVRNLVNLARKMNFEPIMIDDSVERIEIAKRNDVDYCLVCANWNQECIDGAKKVLYVNGARENDPWN